MWLLQNSVRTEEMFTLFENEKKMKLNNEILFYHLRKLL